MGNRIPNNSTTKRHFITPILFYFLSYFLSPIICAKDVFINVYLKLNPTNQIAPVINSFNEFLDEHQIIKTYKIKPFLNHRPLHITLYLTHYKEKYTDALIQRVKNLAQQEMSVAINSDEFKISTNAYVMLGVENTRALQQLSNKAVHLLMSLRDKNSVIPLWAAHDPKRKSLYVQYGSPSVLELFKPHFSIMDPKHLNSSQQRNLVVQLHRLTQQFIQTNHIDQTAKAYALGVGIADEQGQIIKELASFPLKEKS